MSGCRDGGRQRFSLAIWRHRLCPVRATSIPEPSPRHLGQPQPPPLQPAGLSRVMLAREAGQLSLLEAVLTFLAVPTEPQRLWEQPLGQALPSREGFIEVSDLILPATVALAVAAMLSPFVRIVVY
jgi:hypothetical protein